MGTTIAQKREALEFAQSDFVVAFEKPTPDCLRFYAVQVLVVTVRIDAMTRHVTATSEDVLIYETKLVVRRLEE